MIIKGTFYVHRLLYVIVGHETSRNRVLFGGERERPTNDSFLAIDSLINYSKEMNVLRWLADSMIKKFSSLLPHALLCQYFPSSGEHSMKIYSTDITSARDDHRVQGESFTGRLLY